jgi:dTDP-4-amino-4,6-dideoxygalactose transaminase
MHFIPRNRVNNSLLYDKLKEVFDDIVFDEQYIYGNNVPLFEQAFCKKFGNKYGILTSNITTGITLLCRSLNITYAMIADSAYIGTWLGIPKNCITAVLQSYSDYTWDVKTDSYVRVIEELLQFFPDTNHKIGVIIPHLYGSKSVADINVIKNLSDDIYIIEDMSQSHGIIPHPQSDAVMYSLYPTKPFGGLSDGCIITTNNKQLAKKLKSNSFYGYDTYKDASLNSSNFKMDELNAAFLLAKLKANTFDKETNNRKRLACIYKARLYRLPNDVIRVPEFSVNCIFHMMPIYVDDRKKFTTFMADNDIEIGHHYPHPISDIAPKVVPYWHKRERMSNWNQHVVTLPLSAWHTEEEINKVCDIIIEYCLEKSHEKLQTRE